MQAYSNIVTHKSMKIHNIFSIRIHSVLNFTLCLTCESQKNSNACALFVYTLLEIIILTWKTHVMKKNNQKKQHKEKEEKFSSCMFIFQIEYFLSNFLFNCHHLVCHIDRYRWGLILGNRRHLLIYFRIAFVRCSAIVRNWERFHIIFVVIYTQWIFWLSVFVGMSEKEFVRYFCAIIKEFVFWLYINGKSAIEWLLRNIIHW